MKNAELKIVQNTELNILKEILKIIETHNLQYYMVGGTLLGAVRHKGFIPWDDDLDIAMPRPDYEKFAEIASNELAAPFAIHSLKSGLCDFSYPYIRVVDTRLKVVCRETVKELVLPIWVDVFPLDGVPENKKKQRAWLIKGSILQNEFRMAQLDYYYFDTQEHKTVKEIVKTICFRTGIYKLINKRKVWEKLDKHSKMYDYNAATKLINTCVGWTGKNIFSKEDFEQGQLLPFEDLMLVGPHNYDYVLTYTYGDYMTPPDEEDRQNHAIGIARE